MLITVTTDGEEIYNLEIDSQMAIEDLKALLEAEVKWILFKEDVFIYIFSIVWHFTSITTSILSRSRIK
jgi:hypothetical protein